eukprot:scaffold8353_cov138-Cylindrotheca_fusiformis.AAC.15
MADRYAAAYDLDSFGNRYQGSGTSSCMQQQRRHYLTSNGPCMEDYDPSRILDPSSSYNSTGSRTHRAALSHPMMPANHGTSGLLTQTAATGMHLQGIADFEPLPIGKAALQRLNPPHTLVALNSVRQEPLKTTSYGAPSPLNGTMYASNKNAAAKSDQSNPENKEIWLDELKLSISGISLEPMNGSSVVLRVQNRATEVTTRYLPCVDFLVQCQQELRKGLAIATRKSMMQHMFRDSMSPSQFYKTYVSNLPERFYRKNRRLMDAKNLDAACKELQGLCANARAAQNQGCEVVKNTFLGGMKDGESWGLRKWLSKHGGALQICNDCECVLNACQKLDRSLDSTRKLGERLRPMAIQALKKLRADVPSSYQEQSSAHPYLPFFHRLESALRGMSNFDPEDDDVICIEDDDEVEAIKSKATASSTPKKRKAEAASSQASKKAAISTKPIGDEGSIEDVDTQGAVRALKKTSDYGSNDDAEYMKQLLQTFDDDSGSIDFLDHSFFAQPFTDKKDALDLAAGVDQLAGMFDTNEYWNIRPNSLKCQAFWDEAEKYASALRLFSEVLRSPDSAFFVDAVDDEEDPTYSKIIKHPLCFRDIVSALLKEPDGEEKPLAGSNGSLPTHGLSSWNMWHGKDLLQAIDLVFLNSLAYGKFEQEGQSDNRSKTNKLRKQLWGGIKNVIDIHIGELDQEQRRRCTPTRRGESSGFVIRKR